MNELQSLAKERKQAHSSLLALESPVYKAFLEMEQAAYQDRALSKMHKELMAVAISVVLDCRSCMQWHIEQAASAGATRAQLLEALEVAMEMAGGPATVSTRFALKVMDAVF